MISNCKDGNTCWKLHVEQQLKDLVTAGGVAVGCCGCLASGAREPEGEGEDPGLDWI